MTTDVVTCREDDDVSKALSRMAERKVRRLPVVDGNGQVRGIIAQADIATRMHQDKTTGALVEAISEPGTVSR
jgi:CBS domain-containing protein